ncbi:MAG: hypothetical protein GX358_04700 [candidate division WS1 bacterium]|nr:hypothetical protein [candidate division WS1 bacterium]
MVRWRTPYMVVMGLFVVAAAVAQQDNSATVEDTGGQVAVVISMYGEYATAVNITLPTKCTEDDARQALEQVAAHTGWQFDTPIIGDQAESSDGCMSVQANLAGLSVVRPGSVQAVAPLIMALAQYPEAAIIFLGMTADNKSVGSFENRYVRMSWLQQGGVCSYQVSITDRSFASVEELTMPEPSPEEENTDSHKPLTAWFLLAVAALVVGVLLYRLTALLISRR